MAYEHTVLERMTVMLSSPIQMIPSIDAHTSVRAGYLSLTSCLYSSIFAGEGIAIDASGLFFNTSMTKLQLREEILVSMSMQAPDPRYRKQSPCTFVLWEIFFQCHLHPQMACTCQKLAEITAEDSGMLRDLIQ